MQIIMDRPSDRTMQGITTSRLLKNCPVKEDDVANARKIFGPIGALKGKTVRRRAVNVDLRLSAPPVEIMRRNRDVTMCFDIMHLNRIPFLVSISRNIKFCTAETIANRQDASLIAGLKKIKATYADR